MWFRRRKQVPAPVFRLETLEDRSVPAGAGFLGGESVATGDYNNDGYTDVVVGSLAAANTPAHIRVISGADGRQLASFFPFGNSFTGGVSVAMGDFDQDGFQDIVAGAGPGAQAQVNIFSGKTGRLMKGLVAINDSLLTGVNVATGDFNGDGFTDIVAGAKAGAKPWVQVIDGRSYQPITTFFAFDEAFRGGVNVAMGDMVGDAFEEVITSAGPGGPPQVNMFNRTSVRPVGSMLAFDRGFTGGVQVATMYYSGSAYADLAVASGAGPASQVVVFRNFSKNVVASYGGTPGSPTTGYNIASGQFNGASTINKTGNLNVIATNQQLVLVNLAGSTDTLSIINPVNKTVMNSFAPFTGSILPSALGDQNFTSSVFATGPTVANPISNITVNQGQTPAAINLSTSFSDRHTTNSLVQLDTNRGKINMELIDPYTPKTADNLINYVEDGSYASSFHHRLAISSGTKFVLQGGGFTFKNNAITAIPTDPPVQNEPGVSNTYGTIAMAKLGGDPNSATSQYFFNLGNNSANLNNQNGGFTVFGMAIGSGMNAVEDFSSFPISNRSSTNSALNELPLAGYTGTSFPTDAKDSNFSFVKSATLLQQGVPLVFTVQSNTNPGLVTTSITNGQLTVTPVQGASGTSTITVKATNKNGQSVLQSFTVTINP